MDFERGLKATMDWYRSTRSGLRTYDRANIRSTTTKTTPIAIKSCGQGPRW